MELEKENHHPRDKDIIFDEEPHIYYIKGSTDNTSVTTFVKKMFPHFDADKVINKMMKNPDQWKKNKHFDKSVEEIKKEWELEAKKTSEEGTQLHKDIELFYNNNPTNNYSQEYQYFLEFNENIKNKLIPYRTEWIVFDEDYKIAGSIDMVFKKNKEDDKHLVIYDWKRVKNIQDENRFERGFKPINHLPNSNYWHYSLQLNIYKRILEKNYDKIIDEMYLLWLHPNNKSYIEIKVPDLSTEIDNLFT